ncbi:Stf0 family sulfotransferase [uncultured Tateyamaria sp.]|uniref:Stf0 family sulfotransferase n=1 Tax=Tateyamaria sp. 1078 TaxID=3417464 RepID=UPI0026212AA6|nr:Stf0 family sulfotransferase [uncultured Tateyamaria sp.]
MAPRSYILCTAPRSGSTMLCGMLSATGIAGAPQSYFHRPDQTRWACDLGLSGDAPLDQIIATVRTTATEGVTGIRLQQHSVAYLMDRLSDKGATDPERLENVFGPLRYIWLRRQDKVAQAVSLLRAEQTGLWHRNADGTDLERIDPSRNNGYDADAITAQIAKFEAADRAWLNWFAEHRITPHATTYETFAEAPQKTLANLLTHIGYTPEQAQAQAGHIPVPTRKLADAISDDWTARYLADVLAKRSESP